MSRYVFISNQTTAILVYHINHWTVSYIYVDLQKLFLTKNIMLSHLSVELSVITHNVSIYTFSIHRTVPIKTFVLETGLLHCKSSLSRLSFIKKNWPSLCHELQLEIFVTSDTTVFCFKITQSS